MAQRKIHKTSVIGQDEFLAECRRYFDYAEIVDTSFGRWDSRIYSVLIDSTKKLIAVAHINRENYGTFTYDIITSDRLISQIDSRDVYDTLKQLVESENVVKTYDPPSNLRTKNFVISRLLNSGYYINYLKDKNANIQFSEDDMRKWIISLNPNGSSLYLIRYKDGTLRYYDGGQMVPLYYPKLFTESTEVIMEDLHRFGCQEKSFHYLKEGWFGETPSLEKKDEEESIAYTGTCGICDHSA